MEPKKEHAWEAFATHGRAARGRPRKDSQKPTLSQLGFSKWEARKAVALASIPKDVLEKYMNDLVAGTPGKSVTAIIEQRSRYGRQRNPLFRAWRIATSAEREAFISALDRARFFTEREEE